MLMTPHSIRKMLCCLTGVFRQLCEKGMQNSGRLSHRDDADPRRNRYPKQDDISSHVKVPSQILCDAFAQAFKDKRKTDDETEVQYGFKQKNIWVLCRIS